MPAVKKQSEFCNKGILKCARYSFMPNKLGLCGTDKNADLFHYCVEKKTDQGLNSILRSFQVLYPYLKLIAHSNQIRDPFDERVVEAYWIGNGLLDNISKSKFYCHLLDGQQLKKKLNKKMLDETIGKIPLGAKPHHSFHVLNVGKRTGHLDIFHTLSTMDLCKISWGKIKEIYHSYLEVEYQPLIFEENRLKLGLPINHQVLRELNGLSFIGDFQVGQWVSFHWGFVCEVLGEYQVKQLKKYTEENINLCMI